MSRADSIRRAGTPLRLIYVGRMVECQKRVSRLVDLARRAARGRYPDDVLDRAAVVRFAGDLWAGEAMATVGMMVDGCS